MFILEEYQRMYNRKYCITTSFSKGELPFRYLGVPLSSKKLSISQCQPLIDKIMGRINTWTNKFLSYAVRLQLVNSVLLAMQGFWSQIFLMPKKVLKKIESMCRMFLWNGEKQGKGKALIAWETLCLPKVASGLNITNMYVWNKEAILKHLWNLCKKKDKLDCMGSYLLSKGKGSMGSWNQASIIDGEENTESRSLVNRIGLQVSVIMEKPNFSIKEMYQVLKGSTIRCHWEDWLVIISEVLNGC